MRPRFLRLGACFAALPRRLTAVVGAGRRDFARIWDDRGASLRSTAMQPKRIAVLGFASVTFPSTGAGAKCTT